jgi:DNA-binding GntR family transcriptional regulator
MARTIDRRSDRALYLQLADILREEILSGELPPGASLPSEKTIAQRHGLGLPAVRQAINVLRTESLIATERGRPSYVRVRPERTAIVLRAGDEAIARMPDVTERASLALDAGVPVIEVRRADGKTELHSADTVSLRGRR